MTVPDQKLAGQDILLVEDNPQDAELTMRALRSRGAIVRLVWARDGAEALDMLFAPGSSGAPPRFVLLDLKLPKVDGHEVLKRLKHDPRTRSVPVVILSSSGERSDVMRAYDEGANSYVVKPVGYEQFRDTIADLGAYWLGINQSASVATRDAGES